MRSSHGSVPYTTALDPTIGRLARGTNRWPTPARHFHPRRSVSFGQHPVRVAAGCADPFEFLALPRGRNDLETTERSDRRGQLAADAWKQPISAVSLVPQGSYSPGSGGVSLGGYQLWLWVSHCGKGRGHAHLDQNSGSNVRSVGGSGRRGMGGVSGWFEVSYECLHDPPDSRADELPHVLHWPARLTTARRSLRLSAAVVLRRAAARSGGHRVH
jgi:hypothetical protein